MQIVIPMSGIGKRFLDAGYTDPKPLIKVDGKPIIEHVLNLFPDEKNITFICNDKHLHETDMRKILKDISPSSKIFEVPVEGRKGPVHAVSLVFDKIKDDDEVIVSYCDYGTVWDYKKFLKDTREKNCQGAIACYKGFHPHMLGSDNYAFVKEKNNYMIEIKEKQSFTDDKMNEYASNGTYYFQSGKIMKKYFRKLVQKNISVKGEYYVSMVYNLMVKANLKINIFEIQKMLQWGTPYDLEIYKGWSDYFYKLKNCKRLVLKDNLETTLILPMAGKGSRFKKEGYQISKPLLDVDGKPMVVQAVNSLPDTKNKIFVSQKSYNIEKILKRYYDNLKIIDIDYTTKGQACSCQLALENLDLEKPILISACDNGVYYDVRKYNDLIFDESIDVIVWSFRNQQTSKNNPNMYSWLDVDEENNVKFVSSKNFIYDDPLKTHAIIGTFFFRKAKYFAEGLRANYQKDIKTNDEFYVDDVINRNIEKGLKVKVFEVENYICWGTPNDYKTYNYWKNYFN